MDPAMEAEGLYLKATAEYLQGDFPKALEDFEEVRKRIPDDPRLPGAMGEVELSMGKLKEALEHFQAAAKIAPKRATTWNRIGYIQLQYGKLEEAHAAMQKAIALNPKDFTALEGLGDIAQKKGEVDRAVENWMLSASTGPADAAASLYMKGAQLLRAKDRGDDAIALLQKAGKANVQAPELSTLLADLFVHAGKLRDAAEAYEAAAHQTKSDPTLWEMVGEIYVRLDRPANAESAFRESLKIKDRAIVHADLGQLYLTQKDTDRAKQELDTALKVATGEESREAPELARLLLALGRDQDAYKLYKLSAAEPDSAKDLVVQRATAKLAKKFKEPAVREAACKRLQDAGDAQTCR
jgi:tetratricopeptide (TPR) repeat protein